MQNLFKGIFDSSITQVIEVGDFLLCIGVSLLIGIFLAGVHYFRNKASKSILITLTVLPAAVCVVIMMVNGNIGAGVAVAGAFSLVRFRSAPGSAREIAMIFIAMGAGLIAGMGYLAYAALFALILAAFMFIVKLVFAEEKNLRELNIMIPEDLNYTKVFDDLFKKYTRDLKLISVKTSNMGSLYKLKYNFELKDASLEKEFIDELRCRNGNLEISICEKEVIINEL